MTKYVILTKDATGAKEISVWLNKKGANVGASSSVDDKNSKAINALLPWSPGLEDSLTRDLKQFSSFVSLERVVEKDNKSDEDKAWDEILTAFDASGIRQTALALVTWMKANYNAPTKK